MGEQSPPMVWALLEHFFGRTKLVGGAYFCYPIGCHAMAWQSKVVVLKIKAFYKGVEATSLFTRLESSVSAEIVDLRNLCCDRGTMLGLLCLSCLEERESVEKLGRMDLYKLSFSSSQPLTTNKTYNVNFLV